MGGGGGKLQCTRRVPMGSGQRSGAFKRTSDTAPVAQAGKGFKCLATGLVRREIFALRAINVGQVGQGSRRTPRICGVSEDCKRTPIKVSSGCDVSLCLRYVSLLVDRPTASAAITKFGEDFCRFAQSR
jgi:hypothetical protein